MSRKFRFLGYGNRKPFDGDYSDLNPDTQYFFDAIVLTVGKIYEAVSVTKGYGLPDDAQFIDDEGTVMTQELQFFEEIFDESEWELHQPEPSAEELAQMEQSALELRAQFEQ